VKIQEVTTAGDMTTTNHGPSAMTAADLLVTRSVRLTTFEDALFEGRRV
jgi:hypothetical protein